MVSECENGGYSVPEYSESRPKYDNFNSGISGENQNVETNIDVAEGVKLGPGMCIVR